MISIKPSTLFYHLRVITMQYIPMYIGQTPNVIKQTNYVNVKIRQIL